MPLIPITVGIPDDPGADTLWTTGNTCNTNFTYLDNRINNEIRGKVWDVGKTYAVGDIATEGTSVYVCIQISTGDTPSTSPLYWSEISGGSGIQDNLSASASPITTDDSSSGYSVGSVWIDTTANNSFICVDANVRLAVWKQTNNLPNVVTTTDPDASDDSYDVGTTWVNTTADTAFICVDNTAATAVWVEITGGGDGGGLVVEEGIDNKKIIVADDSGTTYDWRGTVSDEASGVDANFVDATFARVTTDDYKWTRRLKRHTIEKYLEGFEVLGGTPATIEVNVTGNDIFSSITGGVTYNLDTSAMPNSTTAAYIHIIYSGTAVWPGITYGTGWNSTGGQSLLVSDQLRNYPFELTPLDGIHIITYYITKDNTGSVKSYGNVIGSNYTTL